MERTEHKTNKLDFSKTLHILTPKLKNSKEQTLFLSPHGPFRQIDQVLARHREPSLCSLWPGSWTGSLSCVFALAYLMTLLSVLLMLHTHMDSAVG